MIEKDISKPEDSFTFPRTGHVSRNRSVLAAMTNKQSHKDGSISDQEIRWLNRRAEGGFGIVLLQLPMFQKMDKVGRVKSDYIMIGT